MASLLYVIRSGDVLVVSQGITLTNGSRPTLDDAGEDLIAKLRAGHSVQAMTTTNTGDVMFAISSTVSR